MTPEAQNAAIHSAIGAPQLFFLKKRGYYYRTDAKGYTACQADAWRLTEEEANKHVYPHDEPVTKHPVPVPNYFGSLDSIHEAEKTLTPKQWGDYEQTLRKIIQHECDREECYVPGAERAQLIAGFWFYHATAQQRSEAFLRALNLWDDSK